MNGGRKDKGMFKVEVYIVNQMVQRERFDTLAAADRFAKIAVDNLSHQRTRVIVTDERVEKYCNAGHPAYRGATCGPCDDAWIASL